MSKSVVISTYAAYSKDEQVRLASSSGAIFSLLAEQVLHYSGVIYGVAMTQDCKSAEFCRIDNYNELAKLRGSKYLQAKMGNVYQQVQADLETGKKVLFSGTGCQVNGLKGFLRKDYDNLFCVDVICHGVPSPKLWKAYVLFGEKKENSRLIDVNFRCKKNGWSDYGINKKYGNSNEVYTSKNQDPYMLMFLKDYCLRPSCYECMAKKYKRSDITIADFWGIDDVLPQMNDGKGVSLILVRSKQGKKLLSQIQSKIVMANVSYEEGISKNRSEYTSVKRPPERETFFQDLALYQFEDMEKKYAISPSFSLKVKIENRIKKVFKICCGFNIFCNKNEK